jgi:hypothetical protein
MIYSSMGIAHQCIQPSSPTINPKLLAVIRDII